MNGEAHPKVEFWFDPICPWCWMTSRWVAEVAETRGFEVAWHPISLAVINENADQESDYLRRNMPSMLQSHRLGRVIVAAEQLYGPEVVGKLYTAFGNRLHPEGRRDFDTILTESLGEADLSGQADLAADDTEFDAVLRANTAHALEIAGPDVGVPVISVDGVAFFGPVVTPAPTGEMALRLWDGIVAAASVPGFYELKRGRTQGPQF